MLMLCDWALYNLSGELASEPSIASSSGMFDLRRRTWSEEVIKVAQLPEGIYPPVFPSGTIIGRVTAKAASETGLIEGTPVVTGGSDSQIAMLGAGVIKPKSYAICGGTFWQTVLIDDQPWLFSESRLKTLCHAVSGQWMSEGSGLLHGLKLAAVAVVSSVTGVWATRCPMARAPPTRNADNTVPIDDSSHEAARQCFST